MNVTREDKRNIKSSFQQWLCRHAARDDKLNIITEIIWFKFLFEFPFSWCTIQPIWFFRLVENGNQFLFITDKNSVIFERSITDQFFNASFSVWWTDYKSELEEQSRSQRCAVHVTFENVKIYHIEPHGEC